MFGFLKQFLGYRTSLAPSGSLPAPEALAAAQTAAYSIAARSGIDVTCASVANTNSMLPTFDSNAVLLLESVPFNRLREGDLVTYRSDLLLVVHRLNALTKRGWEIVGDGNARQDSARVTPDNFDRRVCGIIYGIKAEDTDR